MANRSSRSIVHDPSRSIVDDSSRSIVDDSSRSIVHDPSRSMIDGSWSMIHPDRSSVSSWCAKRALSPATLHRSCADDAFRSIAHDPSGLRPRMFSLFWAAFCSGLNQQFPPLASVSGETKNTALRRQILGTRARASRLGVLNCHWYGFRGT